MEAKVDVVPGTFTTRIFKIKQQLSEKSSNDGARRPRTKPFGLGREVPLAAAWHIRKRSEGLGFSVPGEPEQRCA